MAIVHVAELKPSKLELIASWIPAQSWFAGDAPVELELVGAFRFDDPAGEVGIQVQLVRAGADSPIYQVPMTYRNAPLAGADNSSMGEMTHSVLGRRYVYDGCHDPVFVSELVRAVLTGGTEVVEYRHAEGAEPVALPTRTRARGSGHATASVPALGPLTVTPAGESGSVTTIRSGPVEVKVLRVLGHGATADGATLTGEWGEGASACLATVTLED